MDPAVFDRIDVSHWRVAEVEPQGSNRNRWIEELKPRRRWLHKDTIIPSNGIEQGEDWAEVVSSQVAALLGVPCATTRLCMCDGRRGSISLSVVPDGHDLWEGDVVLSENKDVQGYVPHQEGRPALDPERAGLKRPGHNLPNIRRALRDTEAPDGWPLPSELTAFDVFAGYLLLDALIANRDRHEQNWAIVAPRLVGPPERLAPSYDHAGGLGYNLTDDRRLRIMRGQGGLMSWAERGTAHRFEHAGQPTSLIAHGANAVQLCSEPGAQHWRHVIASADLSPLLDALAERAVDGMSEAASTFAHDLIVLNLGRLRDALR